MWATSLARPTKLVASRQAIPILTMATVKSSVELTSSIERTAVDHEEGARKKEVGVSLVLGSKAGESKRRVKKSRV
jgi:hypothetical protein